MTRKTRPREGDKTEEKDPGDVLKAWLEDNGISVREFGERTAIPHSSIVQYTTKRCRPQQDRRDRIAQATRNEVPASLWAKEGEEPPPFVTPFRRRKRSDEAA